jgi:hypothetical protein
MTRSGGSWFVVRRSLLDDGESSYSDAQRTTNHKQRTRQILLLIAMMLIGLVAFQTARATAPSGEAVGIDQWRSRLESLTPDDAMAYFDLAEDVADAATTDAQRDLARTLFSLAGALDRQHLGRSAALALADMERDILAKTRLLALAALLHNRDSDMAWVEARGAANRLELGGEAALAASEAIGFYRSGDGARALSRLERPGAMALLQACSGGLRGGVAGFLEDCKHYRQQHPPPLTETAVNDLLRLENALLAGDRRPWSSELMLTGGRPLLEVDPDNLESAFGVDVSRPYHRAGRWVAEP